MSIYSCCSLVGISFKTGALVSFLLSVKQIVPKLHSLKCFELKAAWQSYFVLSCTCVFRAEFLLDNQYLYKL